MRYSHRSGSIFLFIVGLLFSSLGIARVEVRFSPNGGVKESVIETLQAAESLDIAMYSFSDKTILKTLKETAERGVPVRLILNKAKKYPEKVAALEAAGIDVRYLTPVMHHKFVIANGPRQPGLDTSIATLLTGSGNWSNSSNARFDEDHLKITENPALILAFQREFNFLWAHSREWGESYWGDSEPVGDVDTDAVTFTSANLEPFLRSGEWSFRSVVESEDGVAANRIIQAIDSAKDSLRIATAHFRRGDISQAVARAVDRGVQVRLLLDGQEFHRHDGRKNTYFDEELAAIGVAVRYKTNMRFHNGRLAMQMHTKYLVVDESLLITGSYNWSHNAELRTFENLVSLSNRSVLRDYKRHFEKVWGYGGEDGFSDLLADIKANKGKKPCLFAPISMTAEQRLALDKAYAKGACRSRRK